MNNESFFPNFNGGQPNQATLNSMNMQAMQPLPTAPVDMTQPVVPNVPIEEPQVAPVTPSPIPEFGVNAMPAAPTHPTEVVPAAPEQAAAPAPAPMPEAVAATPPIEEPTLPVLETHTPEVVPMPAGETPLFDQSLQQQASDAIVDNIPLFNEQNTMPPVAEPTSVPDILPTPTPMPEPTPIQVEATPQEPAPVAPVFDATVPVEVPVVEAPQAAPAMDQAATVEEFLKTNNIEYKLYSNETGKCIIIEV